MEEIKDMLHLDVMTVTGKTLGENLEELKKNGFYDHCDELLREKAKASTLKRTNAKKFLQVLKGANSFKKN